MLEAVQEAQLREHGGAFGIRDAGLLESTLARPRQKFEYAQERGLGVLAAAYVFGIAKNHPFVDGNKRAAFMAAYVFLGLNGRDVDVAEPDVVRTVERVAAGEMSEAQLGAWFQTKVRKIDDA